MIVGNHFTRPPDTVFLMFLCLISGLTQALGLEKSSAVDVLVPSFVFYAWAWILVIGATIALIGIFWRKQPKGMLIEMAGRWMLWPTSFAYGIALAYYTHTWLSSLLVISFGITCIGRLRFIDRLIREWKELAVNGQ